MKTYANGRSVLHQGDGHTQTAAAPDVCKTPSPGGPVPVPYVNVAKDSDLAEGSASVEIEGHPVALKGSYLSTSSGDEAGTAGGGLLSSKRQGRVTFLTASLDVVVEGQGVVRFLDTFLANANTGNTLGLVYGDPKRVKPEREGDIPVCLACGKPFADHEPGLEATEDMSRKMRRYVQDHQREFKELVDERQSGFMLGLLKCRTRNGDIITLGAISGRYGNSISIPRDFPAGVDPAKFNKSLKLQVKRLADRKEFSIDISTLRGASESANKPGNCAAPKLILLAIEQGWEPQEMLEQWFGPSSARRSHGENHGPCETCIRLLPVLLCEARQRARGAKNP